jgi:hypothetical protein
LLGLGISHPPEFSQTLKMKFFENIRRMMEFSSGRNVFLFGRMGWMNRPD